MGFYSFSDKYNSLYFYGQCSLFLILHGEKEVVYYWMLGVEWLALEVFFLIETFLQCHLLPRMSMKLKYNLHLNEESLLYHQLWAPKDFPSLGLYLMLSTVHAVGSLGMLKVMFTSSFPPPPLPPLPLFSPTPPLLLLLPVNFC